MFNFLKPESSKPKFDRRVLRKNDISILILDERWNRLFASIEKPPEILKCESDLKELLKEEVRLSAESKEIAAKKKGCMDKIISLTTEVYENNNENAKTDMQFCQKEIKKINERLQRIVEELDKIPQRIRDANLELLEHTVNIIYFKMRAGQKRVEELETLIEETKAKLMEYIDEKGTLNEDYSEVYSYFHDLLGGEELEKLDKEFFG